MVPDMASSTSGSPDPTPLHKRACALCARRKVKCDKGDPCSNCRQAKAQCHYSSTAVTRVRRKAGDEELVARLKRYEALMRQHSIDYTEYSNVFVPSGFEPSPNNKTWPETPVSFASAATTAFSKPTTQAGTAPSGPLHRSLWTDLKHELQFPPFQLLRHHDDPYLLHTPSLHEILTSNQPCLSSLHPEPRHIYRMWQRFVEGVDPLIKFTHNPTLQQRILDASWDPTRASPSLRANLFSIYILAVTSMSQDDCKSSFGEERDVLMSRYRVAALRALVAADVFTTTDFDVLQALILYLFSDPESSLSFSLTSVASKISTVMGLHRDADTKLSFFEREMRIRLWWQLRGLEMRAQAFAAPLNKPPMSSFGELRLPLNVNDADLHPHMTEAPPEHSGPTEMMFTLLKFQATNWMRHSTLGNKLFESIRAGSTKTNVSVETEDAAINELEELYMAKFLRQADSRIPLHRLTECMARRALSSMRLKIHHPRGRLAPGAQHDVFMTQDELDLLFSSAVVSLETKYETTRLDFSPHLYRHMSARFEIDGYIYMISELRMRTLGDQVDVAWRLVEDLYEEQRELTSNTESAFFVALGDLVLEAWEARSQVLASMGQSLCSGTPAFIRRLQETREGRGGNTGQGAVTLDPYGMDSLGSMDMYDLDWNSWNKFLQL